MNITSLPTIRGGMHRRKRVGRGIGSGHGKTSTRGQKGQKARTGEGKRPGFEGGRTPLIRKLPKRGFRRKATGQEPVIQIVNVEQLNTLPAGDRITPATLKAAGLIRHEDARVKLLGNGAVTKRFTVAVHAASESARAKVTEAGGTVELIVPNQLQRQGAHVQATERAR
ncbi:MAG: 50S ribosomal protein L15 [Candidatus Omnitrophica bacterium]|nr:50S ribosomal protein L15 [Candidatus Omnitrophota bacterium]